MADKKPLRIVFTGESPTALGEFQTGDTIPVENGGTGASDAATARANLEAEAVGSAFNAVNSHELTFNHSLIENSIQEGDPRLTDARTPTDHIHGNLTNAGAIGSTSGVPLITGTSGVIQAGSFGTTAGTFCQGNDSRLSDARTPTAHTHTASNISDSTTAGRALLTAADAAAQRTALDLVKQTDAADRTAGRVARIDLIPIDPFQEICHIAGMQPTLYLDFARQDFRHYSPSTGLRKKDLADIVTFTRGSTATHFDALGTLSSSASNAPRLDFDPVTGLCRGLLIEESRTNLLTYSEQFDNSVWIKNATTVTANAHIAPSGNVVADKIIPTTASGYHWLPVNVSNTAGTQYTLSVFAKAAEYSTIALRVGASGVISFDLSNGTAATGGTIQDVGNGWYRCSVSSAGTGATTNFVIIYAGNASGGFNYVGDGTSGVYIWGAQLEQGSFPTSYIPTTTTAARAADLVVIDGKNFSDFYINAGYTFLAERNEEGTGWFASLDVNTNNRIGVYSSGAFVRVSDTSYTLSGDIKKSCVARINADALAVSLGGGAVISRSVDGTISPAKITLGQYSLGASNFLNDGLKRAVYFPRSLSDTKLQILSSLGA